MKTLIEGGWVVAFNGTRHEVYEQGSVVFEDDRIVHAGGAVHGRRRRAPVGAGQARVAGVHQYPRAHRRQRRRLPARSTWRRTTTAPSNYMSFAAPLKGKMTPPPPEAVAALRAFVFLHALKSGTTTIIDVGGLRGDWEGYVRLVDELGVRVYGSPPFRDRNTFTRRAGAPLLRRRRRRRRAGAEGGGGLRPSPMTARRRGACAAC